MAAVTFLIGFAAGTAGGTVVGAFLRIARDTSRAYEAGRADQDRSWRAAATGRS